MSELRLETWTLPAAGLGPENPLPPLAASQDLHTSLRVDESVPEEDRVNLGWGRPPGPLPYRMQDGYDRDRRPRAFRVAVLENERLRAAFFLELGGRLWSLEDKSNGRELLACNPVFQPCNLAIRNAWISGGVEWNIGWTGHWPYTCSPLFAARFRLPDGSSGLRMWEWERVRQVPFQIDAWLPSGSPVLLVRVAIRNPHDRVIPMYWWSNIAVEQRPGRRVVAPADDMLAFRYDGGGHSLACVPVPCVNGTDTTYPAALPNSWDGFYRVPAGTRPWIAALDADGGGFFQTSTDRLLGRKLFRWGTHAGGRTWQRWLGTPDYIEIQAGLARTQMHHVPMPAGTTWTWVEAYGNLQANAAAVHGNDWRRAREAVASAIDMTIPRARLERFLKDSDAWAGAPVQDLLNQGSGWGALEALRRARAGEPPMELPGVAFHAASLGSAQAPWRQLLDTGHLPPREPASEPGDFMVQPEWMVMLERSLEKPGGRHWAALLHHGVMLWHAGRPADAEAAWRASCAAAENAWALRCLGVAAVVSHRPADAVALLEAAVRLQPGLRPLVIEYLTALLADARHAEALAALARLPPALRNDGRLRLIEGWALLGQGEIDTVAHVLTTLPPVADTREGATGQSDLWFELQGRRAARVSGRPLDDATRADVRTRFPPPAAIDFRPHE